MTADLQPSSVLSDATIRELIDSGRIVIDPFDPSMIQPASVDIRLGNSFRVFHNHRIKSIDLGNPPRDLTEHVEIDADDGEFVIHPGEFVLGTTQEYVEIPEDVVCRIEGKSSIGRLGLVVHATAGFVDPGFQGTLTLEIANFNSVPIVLRPGLFICQLSFMALDRAAERPYGHPELGSHYHGQREATESRYRA
ncbi:MAG TPA: dCTP deaminase [Thermoleophilaceae bacterium]